MCYAVPSNGVFVAGPIGSAILVAETAWQDYRREHNIRDPFRVELDNRRLVMRKIKFNGVEVNAQAFEEVENPVQLEPGEKERYMQLKDLFIATYVFHECGYNTLIQARDYAKYAPFFKPCDDFIGQCSLYCPNYGHSDCHSEIITWPEELGEIWNWIMKEEENDDET